MKSISFTLLVLLFALSSSCSHYKALPVPERCSKDIKQANQLFKEKSKNYNKADTQRIRSLIKAAKIQQQHGRFNTCIDKINRALTLMHEDNASKQNLEQHPQNTTD